MTQLDIEGTYNIRDLGGITVSDTACIQSNILLRSGNLDKLPGKSQQELIDYGVKTIIDLRNEWEAAYYPNRFRDSGQVHYYNLPLVGDRLSNDESWTSAIDNCGDLAEIYIKYIDSCKIKIERIISAIASHEAGIIIHCHAGKDRTGIISALVLGVIGVSDDDIASDYALSRQNIEHLVQEWRTYAKENNRDLEKLEREADSSPETILKMLEHIRHEYSSIEEYLIGCGVRKTALADVKLNFVHP